MPSANGNNGTGKQKKSGKKNKNGKDKKCIIFWEIGVHTSTIIYGITKYQS